MNKLLTAVLLILAAVPLSAQKTESGTVTGTVVTVATGQPIEYAAVTLVSRADGKAVRSTATDAKGAFSLEQVPYGDYTLRYGVVGTDSQTVPTITVDTAHPNVDFGRLAFGGDAVIRMDKVEVTARQEAFYNSIDRKVYDVGKDIQSATGSASDLLQNVPSVQVDIEGNVSLRGDSNVLILINGRPSTLMGPNRAMVLEQMPADSIERIEVITNPSAKYKPDGTAGIINLKLKRKQTPGYSGILRANVGTDDRYNLGVTANYNPGPYNVFGTVSVRQDDRRRFNTDTRAHLDPATNTVVTTEQQSQEHSRPLSRLAQGGVDYNINDDDKVGTTVSFNRRTFVRRGDTGSLLRGADAVTGDYDRLRTDYEWEQSLEGTATYQHAFSTEGHELNVELKHGRTSEQEDNRYSNLFRTPAVRTTFDNTLIKTTETGTEATAEYAWPIDKVSKLDAGYAREANKRDMDFRGSYLDSSTGAWITDTAVTNRFLYHDTIDALYGTYARSLGNFGFLAGGRLERACIDINQLTARLTGANNYVRFYPSLHLSYNLTDTSQLQLNYSHRIHRPESDDLNPFPEYQDPFNLHAGNPNLKPEETHSFETGYQYRKDDISYLATVYWRQSYHGFTDITRYINGTTLLTTKENLASGHSGGLELGATTNLWSKLAINFSSNAYYNEIDARNLGYGANRSSLAWNAKLNASWHATKTDLVQFNTNYTAKRLTAQGDRLPTFVANVGYRHNFADKRTAFVLTVSDVFHSLRERTHIDTPTLRQESTRRGNARIFYAGFIYNFGKAPKKKDDALQFDNQL